MPRRVLLVKPCCIGDVALTTPLVVHLAAAWPGVRVQWAVDRHAVAVVEGLALPGVSALDASGLTGGRPRPGPAAAAFVKWRRGGFDAVIVPDRSRLLAALAAASGAPTRAGLGGFGRDAFLTHAAPIGADHEAAVYMGVAEALGLGAGPLHLRYVPPPAARTRAAVLLPGQGPRLVIHPGGGVNPGMTLTEKRWPAARFGQAAGELARRHGVGVVLVGGAEDRAAVAATAAAARDHGAEVIDLSGLNLAETVAVVERSRLFLGNDTGLAHLATAVGTPAVVVFGPTDPRRYGPLPGTGIAVAPPPGTAAAAVLRLGSARGSDAILAVSVEAVVAAAGRVLAGEPSLE